MEKVIVAGANGFLGKHIVKELVNRGYNVVALSNHFDSEISEIAECVSVKDKSYEQLFGVLEGSEYGVFFDFAWQGTKGKDRADYTVQLRNVQLTCEYVKLAAALKCKRFVYASSINEIETYEYMQSNYAEPSGGYIYGTGKLAAHFMGETVAQQLGVDFIPVMITNIYGVGELSERLICSTIKKMIKGEHCSFTEGYQMYDFIYITDAIRSVIEVGFKGYPMVSYYIGSGHPRPLREFLLELRDIVAPMSDIGLGEIPFRGVSIDYSQFELKRVEKDTGYINKTNFESGIRMTAKWLMAVE